MFTKHISKEIGNNELFVKPTLQKNHVQISNENVPIFFYLSIYFKFKLYYAVGYVFQELTSSLRCDKIKCEWTLRFKKDYCVKSHLLKKWSRSLTTPNVITAGYYRRLHYRRLTKRFRTLILNLKSVNEMIFSLYT